MPEETQSGTTVLHLNESRCEGYGFCEERAAALVRLDEDGHLHVLVDRVAPDQLDLAQKAVRSCPVAALRLESAGA